MADPTRSPTAKSEAVYRTTYATIAAILGEDKAFGEINRETCRELLSILQCLPSNAKKRLPSMSPREAAAYAVANDMVPMSIANANEYMNKLSTLFNWAMKEELVGRNPANGLRLANPVAPRERRNPFTSSQLTKIFSAPLYRGCRDDENGYAVEGDAQPRRSRFWIPVIGLFSGMRLNEICQMHTADLKQVDGIWCFDVRSGGDDGKSLKTVTSQRLIPVHPVLEQIGLLAYHADRKKAGDERLFPEIAIDAFGLRSGRVSRWFSRFLETCGAAVDRTCFHSFRHNFRDALREARVEREIALNLGGWAASDRSDNAVGDGYGRGYSVNRR